MNEPTQCIFWKKPKLIKESPMKEAFDLLETYLQTEHHWQYLLKCRECGQLYFYEFTEQIDWVNGNDPQFTTYTPVESAEEAKMQSFKGVPRLVIDFPSDAKEFTIRWDKI